ncbi:hypothetical protein BN1012_Phect1441 [Candidatus Phaeomarinobacter ectocarpi]|uniref:Co-chaperone DjlA N-terminal domain-containing protein n=1 Tax=Candidatus Phaeomarinibacter ectocarpi TaxID=1458461 RepID=X5MLP4_9HYPH|nr:hypothetical protein [Candidatus Phaeomarinobacter ectocarpi]CDO59655.1 hypothetical protein BN1012_Phect1441 [Candidatus Phaeomarinobacter ectocarpi]
MHILLGVLGIVAAAFFFYMRSRGTIQSGRDLAEAANDVRLAARRFGFSRKANIHAVDSIDDPRIAAAGIAVAFLELDSYPTQETRDAMLTGMASEFGVTRDEADEMAVLGRWLMNECGSPDAGISRMASRLRKLTTGGEEVMSLLQILRGTFSSADKELNAQQTDALSDIQRIFKLK